ncbi:5-methyltetrahydropteroyltriglutamate--homocysteine S-methyltransferase [Secundilactobacillus similis DSM 23365 = JCM 2765]|uniref:5-methyltetrahydropteroyltriglutamate--homocysteine S-methyltransferase n=1 Tax=Secundilactobacillus similis DSM 23365 = JCM 2765 TaxID=1423804 RepID=A0A0R2FIZ4_9LACO|nr:5-methyltetrahydropteroyltriglutamate--homocysteine S-methyltransferase [Secundilactobacillus similis]KRN24983.1 5-methyltetrahydropteroyltriglutamate--homocysteine S-methyltransferase [Secundilactobacillus similis DSM 23365 = JCM 2765]
MTTTITGYPRIGRQLELKTMVDHYLSHQISITELIQQSTDLQHQNWATLHEAGIDQIPVNDFALLDRFLDTAVLFNLIPERFRQLHLPPLELSFALAAGIDDGQQQAAPLRMHRWFNTNYNHYVPEFDDYTFPHLVGTRFTHAFRDAQALGYDARPVLIGPYTLLKCSTFTGKRAPADYVTDLVNAYADLFRRLMVLDADWIQLDEPALVLAPTQEDLALFDQLYQPLLSQKETLRVLIQTAFGDVREAYSHLITLPIDGLGLDLLPDSHNWALLQQQPLPDDKHLFAGIINGQNIWRTNYADRLARLQTLPAERLTLTTSCSLLHVPVTVATETQLPANTRQYLAFAEEKLEELVDLDTLLKTPDTSKLAANQALFDQPRIQPDSAVKKRITNLAPAKMRRQQSRQQRAPQQQQRFNFPALPTQTIGSFPTNQQDRQTIADYAQGSLSESDFNAYTKQRIRDGIALQKQLGLDVFVTGEYTRTDMITHFDHQLSGFLFTEHAWIQSFGTYCAQPPIIWGDIAWQHPITVAETAFAQTLTEKPVKGVLTGPMTLASWAYPREDLDLKTSATQIALALQDEATALEQHGIAIIQLDEPAFRTRLPLRHANWQANYLDWAIPVIRLATATLKPTTQVQIHICEGHYTDILPELDQLDADVLSLAFTDPNLLPALKAQHFETPVGLGVFDTARFKLPTETAIETKIRQIHDTLPDNGIWINPDCGLKTLPEVAVTRSLQRMVTATEHVRQTLN